jgi:hypothetical protein
MIVPLLARNVTAEMQASKEKSTSSKENYVQIEASRRDCRVNEKGWTPAGNPAFGLRCSERSMQQALIPSLWRPKSLP